MSDEPEVPEAPPPKMIVVHTAAGAPRYTIDAPYPVGTLEGLAERGELYIQVEPGSSIFGNYVRDGELVPRPTLSLSQVFGGVGGFLPNQAVSVSIDGASPQPAVANPQGILELSAEDDGTFKLVVYAFPYLDMTIEVNF